MGAEADDTTPARTRPGRVRSWWARTLRRRFAATVALMLVPVLAVSAIGPLIGARSEAYATSLERNGFEELERVARLERLTLRALARAEQQSITTVGRRVVPAVDDRPVLPRTLRASVEETFAELRALDSTSGAQLRELATAEEAWGALVNVSEVLEQASVVTTPPLLRMTRERADDVLNALQWVREETAAATRAEQREFDLFQRRVQVAAAVVSIVSLLVVLVLGGALTRSVLAPVRRLQEAAGAWSDGGLHHRVSVRGDDELSQLARTMNRMAAQIEDQQRTLAELSVRDGLTGLVNRSELEARLRSGLRNAALERAPLSFLLVDIDYFKQVNDEHGHLAGDEVLRQVAALLSAAVRAGDTVGRYGGDELAVLLPAAPQEQALEIAGRVRAALAGHPIQQRFGPITLSIGAATTSGALTPASLIAAADHALYEVKQAGRDAVRTRAPVPEPIVLPGMA